MIRKLILRICFGKYDLTLVNVFTTWCSPCVNEIRSLKLYQGLRIRALVPTGVVDTADEGNQDEQAIKRQSFFQGKTKATYPFPDSGREYDEWTSSGHLRIPGNLLCR